MSKNCAIDGCDRRAANSRGWCQRHYLRWWRYGDPLKQKRIANGEALRYFEEVVLAYDGDDCLLWPFWRAAGGYAYLRHDGRDQPVSRIACEAVHGPPPTPDHESAHSCGRGHLGCVTKRHLSWKTHAENMADMLVHGTSARGDRNGSVKLTESDVRQIRELGGSMLQQEIAKAFGVSRQTVGDIIARKSWGWLRDDAHTTPTVRDREQMA